MDLGRGRVHVMASTLLEEPAVEQEAVQVTGINSVSSYEERDGIAASTSTTSGSGTKGSSKWTIDPNEQLRSNWEHRAWTFGSMGLMTSVMAVGFSGVDSTLDAAGVLVALAASYVLSDLGTGIYHWGVDNYGDGTTPMFGRQIAAFQGHHQRPWTITQREFCNNVHQVRLALGPQ